VAPSPPAFFIPLLAVFPSRAARQEVDTGSASGCSRSEDDRAGQDGLTWPALSHAPPALHLAEGVATLGLRRACLTILADDLASLWFTWTPPCPAEAVVIELDFDVLKAAVDAGALLVVRPVVFPRLAARPVPVFRGSVQVARRAVAQPVRAARARPHCRQVREGAANGAGNCR
jgi:hypothetical protein